MKYPSKEAIERLRREYPIGTRVVLERMDDVQASPVGTKGTVKGVDDAGSIMVAWDNGCGLSAAWGKDVVGKVSGPEVQTGSVKDDKTGMGVCPRCGRAYSEPPAISRVDNETPICPDCGTREALESIGVRTKGQDSILEIIHRAIENQR